MRKILFVLILLLLVLTCDVFAQDTLPKISIKPLNNKILLSWRNEYKNIVTVIDIQRSIDSLKNFYTIGTILNPSSEDNGFVDTKPLKVRSYYRVFIAFEGGFYAFSKSYRKPAEVIINKVIEKIPVIIKPPVIGSPEIPVVVKPVIIPVKPLVPKKNIPVISAPIKKDSVVTIEAPIVFQKTIEVPVAAVKEEELINLKRLPKNVVLLDSITVKNSSIATINNPELIRQRLILDISRDCSDTRRARINIRRDSTDLIARLPFSPSKFITIGKGNDVIINLPLFATKKYSIRFYGEKDTATLFEIPKITESYLILEKMNFRHSGWFRYHLYSNGFLVERYKIYIAIDDKSVPLIKEKADK
jgi:hypothetical protein